MENPPTLQLPSVGVTVQRLAVYETKSMFYIVGNDNENSKFRLIKINRTNPKELEIEDNHKEYSRNEMQGILKAVDSSIKLNDSGRSTKGVLRKLLMAFGLLGFVKFTEGYYMVLITRRRKVAQIGGHIIYKVEDISLTELSSEKSGSGNSEESRYVKYFTSLDFSSNFYFCYTYDITRTVQQNMVPIPKDCTECAGDSGKKNTPCSLVTKCHGTFNEKFMWNVSMLKAGGFYTQCSREWIVPLVYGFISQSNISVYGKSIYLTLIARRSSRYAGTRFLKRGMNEDGEVANEVETEQVVHDASTTNHTVLKITAYVQLRGSVPAFWGQDTSTMVPKPLINISRVDPYFSAAASHFDTLLSQYGGPIYVFNLVKNKEKRNHEVQLTKELIKTISYLNQFLARSNHIQYCGFDMSRYSKANNVMNKLEEIALRTFQHTGFFHNTGVQYHSESARLVLNGVGADNYGSTCEGRMQTGAVRTNCVDCLDRTNTAQFVLGKVALGHQLLALGVIDTYVLDDNTPCIHSLEEIYEDHGDTMALQYGGSQLVHRIRGYRKDNPWTSHSVDILNTVSRYYRNAFTDHEKQNAINLFLGKYSVEHSDMSLWEMTSDYYLHHDSKLTQHSYTSWWSDDTWDSLPLASTITRWHSLLSNIHNDSTAQLKSVSDVFFDEVYRPTMLTSYEEHFCLFMPSTTKEAGTSSPFGQVRPKMVERSISVRTKPVSVYNKSNTNTDTDTSSGSDSSAVTRLSAGAENSPHLTRRRLRGAPVSPSQSTITVLSKDEEEVCAVESEQTELEPVISPAPSLSLPTSHCKRLYKEYASASKFIHRNVGALSFTPLTNSKFHSLRHTRAVIPSPGISPESALIYCKQPRDITVSKESASIYKNYCNRIPSF